MTFGLSQGSEALTAHRHFPCSSSCFEYRRNSVRLTNTCADASRCRLVARGSFPGTDMQKISGSNENMTRRLRNAKLRVLLKYVEAHARCSLSYRDPQRATDHAKAFQCIRRGPISFSVCQFLLLVHFRASKRSLRTDTTVETATILAL